MPFGGGDPNSAVHRMASSARESSDNRSISLKTSALDLGRAIALSGAGGDAVAADALLVLLADDLQAFALLQSARHEPADAMLLPAGRFAELGDRDALRAPEQSQCLLRLRRPCRRCLDDWGRSIPARSLRSPSCSACWSPGYGAGNPALPPGQARRSGRAGVASGSGPPSWHSACRRTMHASFAPQVQWSLLVFGRIP